MAAKDKARARENCQLAALERWSRERDRSAATQPARNGLRARYDPGPDVPEPQRSQMIDAGIKAHMLRMRRARAAKAEARAAGGDNAA